MDIIIKSTLNTLQKSQYLLDKLDDAILSNASVPPYNSSIGSHLRHILDFYDCIINIKRDCVDLTARKRDNKIETCCDSAKDYLLSLMDKLSRLDGNLDKTIRVTDDLGLGKTEILYTLSALLAQANSHTIHHYAIINYILDRLGIIINDNDFGYNPTTPKEAAH
ncbi:DinB family protein [Flavivirga rizhaonensis]|uniref:DinB family protein n=1 Tax=Flavivirga rizhaonensis TaxID=2559571 RepID=A0A4S1DW89_9FLAO|nr:DinB family protein [Flavivirga rizhaonensis]TGV01712.1 DinB family protein [Flavivirga rizhaonensis]